MFERQESERQERIRAFGERVAAYVESGNSFDAMTTHEAMVEAVRVACDDAFEDLWVTLRDELGCDCG